MKTSFDLLTDADYAAILTRLCEWRDKLVRLNVTIKPYRKKRSVDQNAYYWGVIIKVLAEHTGYTPAEMHEEILGAYVGWESRTIKGHSREYPRRRTTFPDTMETVDFAGLIETGISIAIDLGIVIPQPEAA